MAGHSHWAGIKHKKGRADKERSKIFSKLSREITVSAKLGDKDPDMNPRLRTAIQAAKQANMPKDNINRAISKSEMNKDQNFENLTYEGFGPNKIALIIETLTENKNRTASSIRAILEKFGGNLGTNGSTKHYFYHCGVIRVDKKNISDEKALDTAINSGAKDCVSFDNYHEIITEKEDFYKVKNKMILNINNFIYSNIEWRPNIMVNISERDFGNVNDMLDLLQDDDDIQNVFHNCSFDNIKK